MSRTVTTMRDDPTVRLNAGAAAAPDDGPSPTTAAGTEHAFDVFDDGSGDPTRRDPVTGGRAIEATTRVVPRAAEEGHVPGPGLVIPPAARERRERPQPPEDRPVMHGPSVARVPAGERAEPAGHDADDPARPDAPLGDSAGTVALPAATATHAEPSADAATRTTKLAPATRRPPPGHRSPVHRPVAASSARPAAPARPAGPRHTGPGRAAAAASGAPRTSAGPSRARTTAPDGPRRTGSRLRRRAAGVAGGLALGLVAIVAASWTLLVPPVRDDARGPAPSSASAAPAVPAVPAVRWVPTNGDEFDGQALDRTRWNVYNSVGGFGNGLRRPSAVGQGDGLLTITARPRLNGGTSGGIAMGDGQLHGRWEFRARADPGVGYSPAVLLWPDSERFPVDGELDMLESPVGDRRTASAYVHYGADNKTRGAQVSGDFTQWHTFAFEWLPDRLTWYVDGRKAWEVRTARDPHQADAPVHPAGPGPGREVHAGAGREHAGRGADAGRLGAPVPGRLTRLSGPRGTTVRVELTPTALAVALGLPAPTEEQAAVIAAPAEPALVVAGAGAGKTETMAARVVWLVATGQALPEQVLGLTFTRKAAQQLGTRVRSRLRRLASSRLLDDLDPGRVARRPRCWPASRRCRPTTPTPGRLVAEHALRLPAEPANRLLSPTAAWQLAHRVVSTLGGRPGDRPGARHRHRVPARAVRRAGRAPGRARATSGALAEEMAAALERGAARERASPHEPSAKYRRGSPASGCGTELLPLVEEFAAAQAGRAGDGLRATRCRSPPGSPRRTRWSGEIERGQYRAVLLDEYQDTGHAQRVLLRALFGRERGRGVLGHRRRRPVPVDLRLARGERGQPRPVPHRLPVPRTATPLAVYGLLTSFRNPDEVLTLANRVSEELRAAPGSVEVGELRRVRRRGAGRRAGRAAPGRRSRGRLGGRGRRVALARARRGRAAASPPTAAVLVRRRADMDPLAAALRGPRAAGRGGRARRAARHPRGAGPGQRAARGRRPAGRAVRGAAAHRRALAAGRGGPGGAVGAGPRARPGPVAPGAASRSPEELALGALPGEHAEQAGLVDAIDDPGEPDRYSEAGFDRIRRLAGVSCPSCAGARRRR